MVCPAVPETQCFAWCGRAAVAAVRRALIARSGMARSMNVRPRGARQNRNIPT
jgi:hypothetical protein